MSNFVWIVPSEKLSSLGSGGISPTYIIPHGQINGHEGHLRGSRLWIVLRGTEDRCIAVVYIKRVERFREGYYANDVLVSCDTTTSFRLSSSYEKAKPYTLSDFIDKSMGTHEAPEGAVGKLKGLISKTVQVQLVVPTDATLKRVKFEVLPKRGKGLAKAALSQITQALPLDQIWASGTGDKLGPFGNFASRLLSLHGYDASQAISFFKANDPLSLLAETAGNVEVSKTEHMMHTIEKSVDLDFTEIVPETIYAREFVPSENYLPDLESAMSKTEAAEKLHQDMLRDISAYLKERGLHPYESTSVDLMIIYNDKTRIFELKSATRDNMVSQVAMGAFQISCYKNAMNEDFNSIIASLIMQKINDYEPEKFVQKALNSMGVGFLIYDPAKPWPDRVDGLFIDQE